MFTTTVVVVVVVVIAVVEPPGRSKSVTLFLYPRRGGNVRRVQTVTTGGKSRLFYDFYFFSGNLTLKWKRFLLRFNQLNLSHFLISPTQIQVTTQPYSSHFCFWQEIIPDVLHFKCEYTRVQRNV